MVHKVRITDQVHEIANRRKGGNNPALLGSDGTKITYRELSNQIASVERESSGIIFLIPDSSVGCVIEYLKALASDSVLFLIPAVTSQVQLESLAKEYRPSCIFGSAEELRRRKLSFRVIHKEFGVHETGSISESNEFPSQLLLSTSGSTGSKQFVRLGHNGLLSNASDIAASLQLCEDDTSITSLPLSYTFGLSVLHSHLFAGGSIVCSNNSVVDRKFLELLSKYRVTSLYGVPTSFEVFERLQLFGGRFPQLMRYAQAGGAMQPAVTRRIADKISAKGAKLFLMYGQTEATARISILDPELVMEFPNSVGKAVQSGELGIGTSGDESEIWFRGPNVMLGYCQKRTDLGAGDLQNGFLATGDTGEIIDGLLYIRGRLKRIAKINGIRFNLDEIESVLSVESRACVVQHEQKLRIYYNPEASIVMLRSRIGSLGLNERDVEWTEVETIPLLESGKVDYASLISR